MKKGSVVEKRKISIIMVALFCLLLLGGKIEIIKADYPENTYVYVAVLGKYVREADGSTATDSVIGINVTKYSLVPTYKEMQMGSSETSTLATIPVGYEWAYRVGYSTSTWPNYGKWVTETKIFKPGESMASLLSYLRSVYTSECRNAKMELIQAPITYNISYHANGGTGTTGSSSHTYDTAKKLTTNGFARKGYTFIGWNTKADGTGTSYADKANVKNLATTNGTTVTLYAQWKVNQYLVTYDYETNGGNYADKAEVLCDYGKQIDFSVQAKKENYTFVGWNTDATATTGLNSFTMGIEPITVYAIFKKDIKITFVERNDLGVIISEKIKTVYNNTTHADFLVEENTLWHGWKNIGWTTETGATAESMISSEERYSTDTNATFYARYNRVLELSYDTNGSNDIIDSFKKDCYYNASGDSVYPKFIVESISQRPEYSFVNWMVESGQMLDKDGNTIENVSQGEEITILEDTILKAIWDKHPVIEATNRHFTMAEAHAGIITEEVLLERVRATDEEEKSVTNPDGILENEVDVIVKNYNASEFVDIIGDSEIPVTYQATDSFGNTIMKTVYVTVTDTTMKKSSIKRYVRFISRMFFIDETGSLTPSEKGGLEKTSIWRESTEYRKLLEKTLLRETSSAEMSDETWVFTYEACKELQTYTRTYGYVGNSLEKFFELFGKYKRK